MRVHLEAFELLFGDEVHHAGDGVRTPGRRRTAGHHVHALDQHLRHQADVHRAVEVSAHDALAVQQNQGTQRGQAAQVQRAEADQTCGGRTGIVARTRRTLQGRQFDQRIKHARLGLLLQVRRGDNRGGGRSIETRRLKAGRGHDDLLDSLLLRHRGAGAQRHNGGATRKTYACLGQSITHKIVPLDGYSKRHDAGRGRLDSND